jgi:hypothetical protein
MRKEGLGPGVGPNRLQIRTYNPEKRRPSEAYYGFEGGGPRLNRFSAEIFPTKPQNIRSIKRMCALSFTRLSTAFAQQLDEVQAASW